MCHHAHALRCAGSMEVYRLGRECQHGWKSDGFVGTTEREEERDGWTDVARVVTEHWMSRRRRRWEGEMR